MVNTHASLASLFTDIATAIRGKTGSTDTIVADNFPDAITNIPSNSTFGNAAGQISTFEFLEQHNGNYKVGGYY